jgi:hypothetical protein
MVKELPEGYPKGFLACKNLPEPLEDRQCKECKYPKMYRIEGCIIYDKYYLCPHCGLCDFSNSRKLTKAENKEKFEKLRKTQESNVYDLVQC